MRLHLLFWDKSSIIRMFRQVKGVWFMPKSKFEEIYRDLKEKVENGDFLYRELLPSENTLIGVYDCSRNTIRRALSGLVEGGYVQSVHGKGVQVIYQPLSLIHI